MNQPAEMSPEDQALYESAGRAESEAANTVLTNHLQSRVVALHVEVLKRDQRIAELEASLADAMADASQDVSGAGSGVQTD